VEHPGAGSVQHRGPESFVLAGVSTDVEDGQGRRHGPNRHSTPVANPALDQLLSGGRALLPTAARRVWQAAARAARPAAQSGRPAADAAQGRPRQNPQAPHLPPPGVLPSAGITLYTSQLKRK